MRPLALALVLALTPLSSAAGEDPLLISLADLRPLLEVRRELTDPLETANGRFLSVSRISRGGVVQFESEDDVFSLPCSHVRGLSLGVAPASALVALNQVLGQVQIGHLEGDCNRIGPDEDPYTLSVRWFGRDGLRQNVVTSGFPFGGICSPEVIALHEALNAFNEAVRAAPGTVAIFGSTAPPICR